MSEWLTLDANVLFYAIDPRDPNKRAVADDLIVRAEAQAWSLTLQGIGELYHSTVRKRLLSPADANLFCRDLLRTFEIVSPTPSAALVALSQAAASRISYWDALMLATAAEAGCTVCFSEDMQDGYRFGAIEVVNPFGPDGLSERAATLLSAAP